MSGKPKQKQYQYSSLEDGLKFLRTFDSRQQVCDLYYDGAKMPFYQDGNIYYKLPNDTYICKERLGREGLRKAIRKWEDPNIYYRIGDCGIIILNSIGEEVGFVKNRRVLETITKYKITDIDAKLTRERKSTSNFGQLSFVYDKKLYTLK